MVKALIFENYRVISIKEVKCWTVIDLEGGGHLNLRRTITNRELADIIRDEKDPTIEIIATELPTNKTEYVKSLSYNSHAFYTL